MVKLILAPFKSLLAALLIAVVAFVALYQALRECAPSFNLAKSAKLHQKAISLLNKHFAGIEHLPLAVHNGKTQQDYSLMHGVVNDLQNMRVDYNEYDVVIYFMLCRIHSFGMAYYPHRENIGRRVVEDILPNSIYYRTKRQLIDGYILVPDAPINAQSARVSR